MKDFEPDATMKIGDGEPVPVRILQMTTARPESERARHWLTGQPLEGVYLREMKRPLRTPGTLTISVTAEGNAEGIKEVMQGLAEYRAALKAIGKRSALFGEGDE